MITVGLNITKSLGAFGALVDPFLLTRLFSYSGFLLMITGPLRRAKLLQTVDAFAPHLLFPELDTLAIMAINNHSLALGPVVCAADDLELSLTGGPDQIEFYDSYYSASSAPQRDRLLANPTGLGLGGVMDSLHNSDAAVSNSFAVPDFQDFSSTGSLSLQQPLSVLSSFHYEHPADGFPSGVKQQLPYVQIQSQPLIPNYFPEEVAQSHFALNMFGNESHPYFNDFKHSMDGSDSISAYGSSIDSYASPLDEMFFKKPSEVRPSVAEPTRTEEVSRKRKLNVTSQVYTQRPSYSENHYDHDSSCEKSEIELPCTLKVDNFKRIKRESVYEFVPTGNTNEADRKDVKFVCAHCDAVFKVKSYLTRHMRKHNNAKAFVCPFFEESEGEEGASVAKNGTKCHPTGGFSRRDTFKTHLKAIHFIYPPGTKSSERNTTGGRCAGCFEYFKSNADWMQNHIEGGACKGTVGHHPVKVKVEGNYGELH